MKNYIQKGDVLDVVAPTGGVTSGQAFMIGNIALVATTTADEGETLAAKRVGVYELAVIGEIDSGNEAVAYGDSIYLDNGALNKDSVNGSCYGTALGSVTSGATAYIPVMIG